MRNTFAYIDNDKRVAVAVPKWLREHLRKYSLKKGVSMGRIATEAIKNHISLDKSV